MASDTAVDPYDDNAFALDRDRVSRQIFSDYLEVWRDLARANGQEVSDAEISALMRTMHALRLESSPRELLILLATHHAATPVRNVISNSEAAARKLSDQSVADAKNWISQAQEVSTELVQRSGESVKFAVAKHTKAMDDLQGRIAELNGGMGRAIGAIIDLRAEVESIKDGLREAVTTEVDKANAAAKADVDAVKTEFRALLATPVDEFATKLRRIDREGSAAAEAALSYQIQRLEDTANRVREASCSWWGVAAFATICLAVGVVVGRALG